jgi:hypothetical protein
MRGPVTYGVVPAGASQQYPFTGAPAPLAPGDEVGIATSGSSIDGVPYFGGGGTTL